MPSTKPASKPGVPPGNRKVMVYVAANVHRAMGQFALEGDRRISSVYVEAAREFLEARGRQTGADPAPVAPIPASGSSELAEAIDRQGRRIEELHLAIKAIQGTAPRGVPVPAGTKAAEAMTVMLRILKAAGAEGMTTRELTDAAYAAGLKSGTAETAKAVLVGAGIIRSEGRRCRLDGV